MESMVKKYQQKFRKIKEEMNRWEELQCLLISQFSSASSIIQRLEVIRDSKNYGALKCIDGIEAAVLANQMNSLQGAFVSINNTMKEFHGIVSSIEKVVHDSKQLVKGGSAQMTAKQLKQRVGVKPTLEDCLEGLRLLDEMHQSEYLLKLSMVSALPALALKPSASGDLGALQQFLVDQPNIPREEGMTLTFSIKSGQSRTSLHVKSLCFKQSNILCKSGSNVPTFHGFTTSLYASCSSPLETLVSYAFTYSTFLYLQCNIYLTLYSLKKLLEAFNKADYCIPELYRRKDRDSLSFSLMHQMLN